MIEAPLNVLMGAIVPLLKSDSALSDLIGARVYDHVPAAAAYPNVTLGAAWEIQDDGDCYRSLEIGFRLDVWSRGVGFSEARRVANAVRNVLHDAEIDLSEGALAMMLHRRTDTMRDPDGLTSHCSVEFTAVIET